MFSSPFSLFSAWIASLVLVAPEYEVLRVVSLNNTENECPCHTQQCFPITPVLFILEIRKNKHHQHEHEVPSSFSWWDLDHQLVVGQPSKIDRKKYSFQKGSTLQKNFRVFLFLFLFLIHIFSAFFCFFKN